MLIGIIKYEKVKKKKNLKKKKKKREYMNSRMHNGTSTIHVLAKQGRFADIAEQKKNCRYS
jgi:hypothetical protein